MRKVLYVLAALLITTPAMAVPNVDITCTPQPGGWVTIGYNVTGGPPKLRAVALEVSTDVGAIVEIRGYKEGESFYDAGPPIVDNRGFGIFPGSIGLADPEHPVWGDPVSPNDLPGAVGTGIGTQKVILELGSLYVGPGNAPLDTGVLCELRISNSTTASPATITVVEETTHRGGVVLEDPQVTPTVSISSPACSPVWDYTGPDTTEWNNVGNPAAWDAPNQCYGDASASDEQIGRTWYHVATNDLPYLVAGWKQYGFDGVPGRPATPAEAPWICADFDHAAELIGRTWHRVAYDDAAVLIANWKSTTLPGDCSP